MNPSVVTWIYLPVTRRAARSALVGRGRDRLHSEKGRFIRPEVDVLIKQAWQRYDGMSRFVPREPRIGNRMNMLLACVTLACLQEMVSAGIERAYAVELIGDVAWKIYEKWGRLPIFFARLLAGDPVDRMRRCVNMFLRFPFTPPGYGFVRLPSSDGISLDMHRCPVAAYLIKHEAADLCVGTWCNQDFALAQMWGGWLERHETLAAGCPRCDFRFKAMRRGPGAKDITGM